jgi:hypothetical protein
MGRKEVNAYLATYRERHAINVTWEMATVIFCLMLVIPIAVSVLIPLHSDEIISLETRNNAIGAIALAASLSLVAIAGRLRRGIPGTRWKMISLIAPGILAMFAGTGCVAACVAAELGTPSAGPKTGLRIAAHVVWELGVLLSARGMV